MPVNTSACLSPKDELAQEYLRIRHMQRIEIDVSQYIIKVAVIIPPFFVKMNYKKLLTDK